MEINSKTIKAANWLIREIKNRFSEDAYIHTDDQDSEISIAVKNQLYWNEDFRKFTSEIFETKEVYDIRFVSLPEKLFCEIHDIEKQRPKIDSVKLQNDLKEVTETQFKEFIENLVRELSRIKITIPAKENKRQKLKKIWDKIRNFFR